MNILIIGIGGQGIVTASDILAEAAYHQYQVKKTEVKGMSQRSGTVTSEIRIDTQPILSPIIPNNSTDYLLILDERPLELVEPKLKPTTITLRGSNNLAILGTLSKYLNISQEHWYQAIKNNLKPPYHAKAIQTFKGE